MSAPPLIQSTQKKCLHYFDSLLSSWPFQDFWWETAIMRLMNPSPIGQIKSNRRTKGGQRTDMQSDAKWTQCLCINILDVRAFASEWSNFLDLLCYSRSVRQEAVEEEEEEDMDFAIIGTRRIPLHQHQYWNTQQWVCVIISILLMRSNLIYFSFPYSWSAPWKIYRPCSSLEWKHFN